jgi:hypothetical protein
MTKPKEKKHSASSSGFHFGNLYQNCPRKFYLRYVLGLEPTFTSPPLINGLIYHEAKAIWYTSKGDRNKAVRKIGTLIKEFKTEVEDPDILVKMKDRLTVLLDTWIEEYGRADFEKYKILGVEKEYKTALLDTNIKLTTRLDLIVQQKRTKEVFVVDTKTSSFSINTASESMYYGDQATAYLWALKKNRPTLDVTGLIVDISYWNSQTDNTGNIKHVRGDIIHRTERDLQEFEEGFCNLFFEISQKVAAVKKRTHKPEALFPRNTSYCLSFFRPCEYCLICRSNVRQMKTLPYGLKKVQRRNLGDNIMDLSGGGTL